MLTLTRRVGETLHIGDRTEIVVEALEHGKVRIRVQSDQATRTVNVHGTPADRPVLGLRSSRKR
jgi:sRNA-binding carbon storage regulator CsrA